MNKNYLLLGAMVSVGMMTSCSTSDTEESTTANGSPAVINLNLNAGNMATRTAATTAEATINTGKAYAFDGGGAIVGTLASFTGYSTENKPTISTTTQATQVSVVVNPGTTATDALFNAVTTKSGLEGISTDLASTVNSTNKSTDFNSQDPKNLPMYGNASDLTFKEAQAKPTVDLYHLVAKIVLTSLETNFTGTGYAGATFTPKEVFLYNASTTCKFDYTGSSQQSGENTDANCANLSSHTDYAYLSTGAIETFTEGSTSYTFYTFPNTADKNPTKLVIKGLFTPYNGTATTVYYPIVINKIQKGTDIYKGNSETAITSDDNDSKIVKNTSYAVSVTIKGKGMASPDIDITPANATVTMKVMDWTDYEQKVVIE